VTIDDWSALGVIRIRINIIITSVIIMIVNVKDVIRIGIIIISMIILTILVANVTDMRLAPSRLLCSLHCLASDRRGRRQSATPSRQRARASGLPRHTLREGIS